MNFIQRNPLVSFFVLAYGIFWLIWIPLIPALQNLATFEVPAWAIPLALFGIYAPTWAALIVTAAVEGRAGVKRLLAPLFIWKLSPHWYLLAIFLPLGLALVALVIYLVAAHEGRRITSFAWVQALPLFLASIPLSLLVKLPLGPMAEELGWRGFALPRMQRTMSAFMASLLLGVLWGLWHLPAFWVPGAALAMDKTPTFLTILDYVINVVGLTILFTWLYNSTRGSLLVVFLFHAAYNALPGLLFATSEIFPETFVWVKWAFAGFLLLRYGPAKLAKDKVTQA